MTEQDVQPATGHSHPFGGPQAAPGPAGACFVPGFAPGLGLDGPPPAFPPWAEPGAGKSSELAPPADLLAHWAAQGSSDTDDHSAASPSGSHAGLPAPVIGRAGAQGRENLIQTQSQRAYEAGLHAPQSDYDGTLHRNVPASRWEGYADHRFGDAEGGRYNAPGERMIYTSPSAAEAQGEMAAYAQCR